MGSEMCIRDSGSIVPGIVIPPIDIDENGKADAAEIYKVKEDAFGAVANGTYPSLSLIHI
mgnify:CR=1 FL=1